MILGAGLQDASKLFFLLSYERLVMSESIKRPCQGKFQQATWPKKYYSA